MRVGIDAKVLSKPYTGIAVYLHSVLSWFQRLEPENEYILFSNRDFDMPREWRSCEKVIYSTKLPASIKVCLGLEKVIDQYNIDIFWGPEHCLPYTKGNYKRVVTFHDIGVLINPKWGTRYNALLQKFMVKRSARIADLVVGISQSTCNDIIKYTHIDPKKVVCVNNGDSPYNGKEPTISEKDVNIVKKKYNIGDEYFLYFGTLEPRKNVVTIIKAYNEYRTTNPDQNQKLVLGGGLGWRYEPILKEIENSPYRTDIIRTGYIDEKAKEVLYRNALCFLFPSLYEGCGFPIIEAMSCGTPVITARNSSLPEVGGDVAFYIDDALDYRTMANLMVNIKELSRSERLELSKKCKTQALKFSRKECAKEILDEFNDALIQENR